MRAPPLAAALAVALAVAVAAAVAAGVLSLAALPFARLVDAGTPTWTEVAPDLYRFDLWWRPLPLPGALVPAAAWLARERRPGGGDGWVLIDAGPPNRPWQRYADELLAAVRAMVPDGQLLAVLLTHTHADHVGALPGLVEAYQEIPVVVHELEMRYLMAEDIGGEFRGVPRRLEREVHLARPPRVLELLHRLGAAEREPTRVPNERISLLRDKNAPGGLPSTKGLAMVGVSSLAWIPTHGHSPGHVSYLHQASGTVVAGDAAMLWQPALVLGGGEARGARGRPAGAARERLMAVTASVIASAGDLSSFALYPKNAGGGVELRRLPFASLHLAPSVLCPRPLCDPDQAQRSACHLAGLGATRLHPSHDLTGKGLASKAWLAFSRELPACGDGGEPPAS